MKYRLKGFSLIEITIVIVLLGIVSMMAGGMLLQGVEGSQQTETLDDLDWSAREGFERLSREIRSVNPRLITAMTATTLTFTSFEGETVSFVFSGSNLTRNGTAFMDNLSSFSFAYYTGAGATTAVAANVRLIQFSGTFTSNNLTSPNYITAVGLMP